MSCSEERQCRKVEDRQESFLSRMVHKWLGARGSSVSNRRSAVLPRPSTPDAAVLRKGELLIVKMSGQCRVRCAEGILWITCPGRFCDYVLRAGESLLLRGEGKVIVSGGLGTSLVRIRHL